MNNIPWSYRLYRLTWNGLDLLFPPVCGGCGEPDSRWCASCQAGVPVIDRSFCETCGIPVKGITTCEKCKLDPPAYRKMRSWAVFDSPVQNGLHSIKYRGNMGLGESIALQMLSFVRALDWPVEMLIPVPLAKERQKARGYNQVGLVARPLAYHMGWKYAPHALSKTRETRSQVGLNLSQRRENVLRAYQAESRTVNDRSILLMDDVATTGSTITACTNAILSAGAREVYVLTIARALPHHSLDRV